MQEINPTTSKVLTILFGVVLLLPVAYVFSAMIIADLSREKRVNEAMSMLPKPEDPAEEPSPFIETRQIMDVISPFPGTQTWFWLYSRLWVGVTGLICCLLAVVLWIYSASSPRVLEQTTIYDPADAAENGLLINPSD